MEEKKAAIAAVTAPATAAAATTPAPAAAAAAAAAPAAASPAAAAPAAAAAAGAAAPAAAAAAAGDKKEEKKDDKKDDKKDEKKADTKKDDKKEEKGNLPFAGSSCLSLFFADLNFCCFVQLRPRPLLCSWPMLWAVRSANSCCVSSAPPLRSARTWSAYVKADRSRRSCPVAARSWLLSCMSLLSLPAMRCADSVVVLCWCSKWDKLTSMVTVRLDGGEDVKTKETDVTALDEFEVFPTDISHAAEVVEAVSAFLHRHRALPTLMKDNQFGERVYLQLRRRLMAVVRRFFQSPKFVEKFTDHKVLVPTLGRLALPDTIEDTTKALEFTSVQAALDRIAYLDGSAMSLVAKSSGSSSSSSSEPVPAAAGAAGASSNIAPGSGLVTVTIQVCGSGSVAAVCLCVSDRLVLLCAVCCFALCVV